MYMLIILMYITINQMRPEFIIDAIQNQTLASRRRQMDFLRRTRRFSQVEGRAEVVATAGRHGYVTRINLDLIANAIARASGGAASGDFEVVLLVIHGSFLAYGDAIARVKAPTREQAAEVAEAVRKSLRLDRQREVSFDPSYGIEQMEMIAWTSISTAKGNPEPGLLTVRSLRSILSIWLEQDGVAPDEPDALPVVYTDEMLHRVMDAFESLVIGTGESGQHHNFNEVMRALVVLYERLPEALRERGETLVERAMPVLGAHLLSGEMEATLETLGRTLESSGAASTAQTVYTALERLRSDVGKVPGL